MLENDPEAHANVLLGGQRPLRLECGVELKNFPVAYQTYGKLNTEKSTKNGYLCVVKCSKGSIQHKYTHLEIQKYKMRSDSS